MSLGCNFCDEDVGNLAGLNCEELMEIKSSKQTQTQTDLISKCEECNFEGSTEKELDWHMSNIHGWSVDHKSDEMEISSTSINFQVPRNCDACDYEAEDQHDLDAHHFELHMKSAEFVGNSIVCNFCDNGFETKRDLMNHKKIEHTEKVNVCWHFSAGTCPFGDTKCWFIHSTAQISSNSSEYNCSFCEKVFTNKSEFLKHRKKVHAKNIPLCKNFGKGACIYGNEKCWFNHNDDKILKESENGNKDVVQRIFSMMEKMTERIIKMEMNNPKQWTTKHYEQPKTKQKQTKQKHKKIIIKNRQTQKWGYNEMTKININI